MQSPMHQQPVDTEKIVGQIRNLIAKQESGIIAISANASQDAIAAATTLYMALAQMGKNISIVASSIPQSTLKGAEKIKTSFTTGGDNLVVSFPYQDGAIDKVDYNIEGERFNLIIVPREGHDKIQPNDVQFTYTGGKVDFIITIDTPNLKSLGDIYIKNESIFGGKNIINIDRHLINNSYGTINLVFKSSSSTSELVMKVIKGLKVNLDKDMATNLYFGIQSATNNLTAYSVNAETYESVASLIRAGAQKMQAQVARAPFMQRQYTTPPLSQQQLRPMPQQQMSMNQGMYNPSFPQQQPRQQGSFQPMAPQVPQQQPQPQPSVMNKQTNIAQVEKETQNKEVELSDSAQENPLKPKIFSRNGGLL